MRRALLAFALTLGLAAVATAQEYKVLFLVGDARSPEPGVVSQFTSVGGYNFTFESVVIEGGSFDGDLRGADILWFPWNGPGHDGNYFMSGAEQAVLDFVQNGGVVWISAFDDNFTDDQGRQVGGWLPIDEHPVIVENTGDSDVELTDAGMNDPLFTTPNTVDMNAMVLDDNFAGLDDSWVILATRVDNGSPAVAYLPYGAGVYLEACVDTRDANRANAAAPLHENALLWLANWIASNATAVDPAGKLTTTWGAVKAEVR
ncbi:MAG: hypothetical protein KatS3mg115_2473 [Candidatus Poribacteria bacterium]|nr:MAG: hypothetical protein KatS3mg115_2473 [Candidatus Poribacteria bacterium]